MKKILLLIYGIYAIHACAIAQGTNTYLNNYVQPAPNAAALGKYVDYPVSYYTGVPSVSIPIYELKDGSAHIPISLSYHASGIRVSEVASWVGLGWCLNAGGVITRTVKGAPDEGTRKIPSSNPAGYYLSYGLSQLPLLPHPVSGTVSSLPDQFEFTRVTVPGIQSGSCDTEPDLFTFNFNGYSGRFVFDENRKPRLLTDDNLQIKVNFDSYYSLFASWIITTPDGVRYFFGENNMQEVTLPRYNSSDDNNDSHLPSSWYLTKIIYPNTKDTVNCTYTTESCTYFDLGPESETYNFALGSNSDRMDQVCDVTFVKQGVISTTVNGLRLTKISSKNDSVVFVAKTQRQDMATSVKPYCLDTVKVYVQGNCIQQTIFSYNYFSSPSTTGLNSTNLAWVNDSSDRKRLKLLSVKFYSGDKSLYKPAYVFQYQEAYSLPRRLSYDQDHWGFSNSSSGNANAFYTPPVSWGTQCVSGGGASRESGWPQMSAATLISIKDPLGVTTKFEFEENIAENYYPSKTVAGLRVKRILTIDSLTNTTNIRKFQYTGGELFRLPKYLMPLKNEYLLDRNNMGTSSGYLGYSPTPVIVGMLKQSQSIVPMQDVNGNSIGYYQVKEIFGDNCEGGYKEYHFGNLVLPTHNSRLSINNFAGVQNVNTIFYGSVNSMMGNGHFNDILSQNLQYYSGYDVDEYYPAAPYQVEFTNGELLRQFTYDSSGSLIQSLENSYAEKYHEDTLIRGLKAYELKGEYANSAKIMVTGVGMQSAALVIAAAQSPNGFLVTDDNGISINFQLPTYNQALTFYKLHTGVSHLTATKETLYKDGKKMVTTHSYGYESALHTLQTSDTAVTSAGDTLISKKYYSFDYNSAADSVFLKMKARNLLLPVATRVWKNNKLMSGTVTKYKDFAARIAVDTLINPEKIYSLETNNTLTTTQAGENIALTGEFSTLKPNNYFAEKATFNYDSTTGKVIEQNLKYDKTQALIWDNKLSLPLAVVDNAKQANIAYNSFESVDTGNWSYTRSYVVADASAPTGGNVYTLNSTTPLRKTGFDTSKKYILSYWVKSGGTVNITGGTQANSVTGSTINTSWTYKQVTIKPTTLTLDIKGTGYIDEVRFYPATAQMVTYAYDSLLRLMNQCTANSMISEYEYDSFNRLTDIKDQNGNILKAFEYNYGSSAR